MATFLKSGFEGYPDGEGENPTPVAVHPQDRAGSDPSSSSGDDRRPSSERPATNFAGRPSPPARPVHGCRNLPPRLVRQFRSVG
jgi:hypothetical protein